MTDAATNASSGSAGADAPSSEPGAAAVDRPGSLPTAAERAAAAKDRVLTSPAAIERARTALCEITEPLSVGEHTAAKLQAERLVTHLFECNLAGYEGWRWAVTMARPPRGRTATVCELELLPGEEALLAPPWVPWADRLRSGDITRSDHLPKRETDERLEPGWESTGEEGDRVALDELDLGRARVLSHEGVQRAAQRWYDGEHGPQADGVRKAHASCSSCGFLMLMAGQIRHVFGVCANELAVDDGRVVSLDHGCGAHSETDLPDQGPEWPVTPSRMDDSALEPLGTDGASIRAGLGSPAEPAGDMDVSGAEAEISPLLEKADKRRSVREGEGSGRKRTRRSRAAAVAAATVIPIVQQPSGGEGAPAANERAQRSGISERPEKPERPEKARKRGRSGRAEKLEKLEKSVENAAAHDEGEPVRASRSRRAARARRATPVKEKEHASDAAVQEPQTSLQGLNEPAAERAAAAREAVAGLKAGMQERSTAPEVVGSAALAELEARLPRRDR
ncbi:DUF3027 domain-containing protein [Actinomyces massiliensis]|uniref:DUF3027 domain-containing protein n=1 Tax=Actinomyces massiliensis TaxID=461393 RepID=UPI0028EA488B|nr:DUF3027 domain-containing protein [Actinomyces massiliensis]